MADVSLRKRIWGWMMFDWASQPYNTVLLTFIFGPFFAEIVSSDLMSKGLDDTAAKALAQSYWGYGLTAAGLFIAFSAPILGAFADSSGRRLPWVWVFSLLYVIGASGLWLTEPGNFNMIAVLIFFGIGLIGMEFATIFTNAMLPSLGDHREVGAISGNGWALGYLGGVFALAFMLLFLAENASGVTLLGQAPLFGLDPEIREGTRFVGPFTAIWYVVFMIPFFLWVREPRHLVVRGASVAQSLADLVATLRRLPSQVSLSAYLGSSMLYRDALNGMFTFGGIYAFGILGWSVIDIGVFGIVAALTGAVFAYIGGRADRAYGPKPVIVACILTLIVVAISIVMISRETVLGVTVAAGSALPDIAFYICGAMIGAAAGAVGSASRSMMVRQANPDRMTEAFGLYALAGKATSFIAPAAIAIATNLSGSQRVGITPLIGLFLIGLFLLLWVKPNGDRRS